MTIKAILFDKDGTLIDVNGTWVPFYQHMLAQEFGASRNEVEAMMVRAGLDPESGSFMPGSLLAAGTTLQMVELWWPDASPQEQRATAARLDRQYAAQARTFLRPLMPLVPVLNRLRSQGLKLGVGTNDSEISARGHMEALGVGALFEEIIGADSVAVPKPSGQMVRHFAEKLGVRPGNVAMVGDNAHDMEEAHNGGAGLAIAVLSGNSGREHMAHLADHVLESIADLPGFMEAI
jgi:phosphoglycolate phosphatase